MRTKAEQVVDAIDLTGPDGDGLYWLSLKVGEKGKELRWHVNLGTLGWGADPTTQPTIGKRVVEGFMQALQDAQLEQS